jgi:hypothetical protein
MDGTRAGVSFILLPANLFSFNRPTTTDGGMDQSGTGWADSPVAKAGGGGSPGLGHAASALGLGRERGRSATMLACRGIRDWGSARGGRPRLVPSHGRC